MPGGRVNLRRRKNLGIRGYIRETAATRQDDADAQDPYRGKPFPFVLRTQEQFPHNHTCTSQEFAKKQHALRWKR